MRLVRHFTHTGSWFREKPDALVLMLLILGIRFSFDRQNTRENEHAKHSQY
jgi:hypothetical protein